MVAILDQFGQPIETAELTEQQTSKIASLTSSFALHPSRGLTPARLARILEDAERGDLVGQCDLFDDLEEKDGHIFAEMSKRRRALLTLDWSIEPPRNATAQEKRTAEGVAEMIAEMQIEEIILNMSDAIGKSYACLEYDWRVEGRDKWIEAATLQPQRWFQLPPNNPYTDELRLRNNTVEGEALDPFGWIVHIHKARPGYLARAALGRILSWPFIFKNYSVRDLAEFLEIYGLPLRLGTYRSGASDKEKATLLRAVVNIGHAAAGIVPEGMGIDFKEAAKGAAGPFQAMIDWCERTQSKAILGQTLTAEAKSTGLGSNLAEVHNEVRHDLLISDAKQIGATLTRDLCYPLAALNFAATPGRGPRFVFDTREAEDLQKYAKALPGLSRVMRIPAKWAHERLRIPEAENDEPILGGQMPAPPNAALSRARRAALKAGAAIEDPPAQMADQLNDDVDPALTGWINMIRDLVESASSLEEIRDGLLELYPDMSLDQYAAAMAEALEAAALAGRYEIMEQANGGG